MAIDTDGVINFAGETHRRSLLTDKATYVLRTGQAKLVKLIIQTVGTTWTITFYDAVSAASGKEIVQWVTADGKGPFEYQIPCADGLTVVSGGTTAGAATIVWE